MKKLTLFLFSLFLMINSYSQYQDNYTFAVGLRGGFSAGVSAKYFTQDTKAIEGIMGVRWAGWHLTGLYEIHVPNALEVNNLSWYYGAGAHIGYNYDRPHWHHPADRFNPHPVAGIDGIIGLEYVISEIPFTVSFDIKPYVDIIGFRSNLWGFWDAAFSIRYIIE